MLTRIYKATNEIVVRFNSAEEAVKIMSAAIRETARLTRTQEKAGEAERAAQSSQRLKELHDVIAHVTKAYPEAAGDHVIAEASAPETAKPVEKRPRRKSKAKNPLTISEVTTPETPADADVPEQEQAA